MKIAIISDVHLGDRNCKVVVNSAVSSTYKELRDSILDFTSGNPLDYLVLNGDILDFSINSFEASCVIAKPFFQAVARDRLARELIYIPGNHDKHIWDAVEWETNIIRRLKEHKEPRKFRRTQPGIIDLIKSEPLELKGVTWVEGTRRYGTLFLEGLFEKNGVIPINVVYPNLYIKTDKNVYMITHGHMLELAWVLLSELLSGEPELSGKAGIAELEEYNVPFTTMICTGVGQAGAVSKLFYKIQLDAKKGRSTRLRKLLDNVVPKLDRFIELPWYAELFDNALLLALRKAAIYISEDVSDSRYDEEFFEKKSVRKRFLRFYAASCSQAEELGLEPPDRIIFGHTHEPIPAKSPLIVNELSQLNGNSAFLYNTGGWLKAEGKSAEVFFLDDNGNLTSVNIK
jgi:UDP-2,3-diacylglucosamine pyrophosphatase LpxH